MAVRVGDRVVVLGGSMGGLLAARVLSESFDEVVLVDRDELSGVEGVRRGVPHGGHAHGLVARGQQILEEQFPGLTAELIDAGVTPGDFSGDIRWYFNGRRVRSGHTGLLSVPATRPVLEWHVRERVKKLPNVRLLERHDIVGPVVDPADGRVTGARVRSRADGAAEQVLDADLVLDTTGRGSRTPAWLAGLGYERPAEERVKIGLAYTTRHYRLSEDPFGKEIAIIPIATPSHPRGGLFYRLPGPGNRVELSLTGVLGDHPPSDHEGFLAFVKSLPAGEIYDAIQNAEPLDDPVTFQFPASVWRHYERLDRFPAGLLVLGDAVCSFNPVYGQGMTVAALESLVLRRHLRHGRIPEPRAYFRDIADTVAVPWSFSAGADLGYRGVEGRRTLKTRLANAYVSRLHDGAEHDAHLTNAFIRAAGLIDPPAALMRPGTAVRVLWQSLRRRAARSSAGSDRSTE